MNKRVLTSAGLCVVLALGMASAARAGTASASPVAVTMVRPIYPIEAQRVDIEGCAILGFDVSADGRPENIRVRSSKPYPDFGKAAQKALAQWRFEPSKSKNGAAAFHGATQAFAFRLPSGGKTRPCGSGTAVTAVPGNEALPSPRLPKPSTTPLVRPAGVPEEVDLNITRPSVTEAYAIAPGSYGMRAGHVSIRFCVNRDGKTERLKILHSTPPGVFDAAALRIMHAAEFVPHKIKDWPVTACGITQTIIFKPSTGG